MSKYPKFSLILPVYNVQDYLSKCLDSIMEQTLLDFEVICVDDGSKDSSVEVLEEYAKMDSRIKILQKSNGGPSSARNIGMQNAVGEYLCFLDSDDYIQPNFCERIYKEILEWHPDIVVFGGKIFPLTKDTDPWTYNNLTVRTQLFEKFEPALLLGDNRGYPFAWRNCFKRSYLEKIQLKFDEDVSMGEDTIFQVCALPESKNTVFIADKLYNYRYDRKNSLMFESRRDDSHRLYQHLEVVKSVAAFWDARGYFPRFHYMLFLFGLDFMGWDLMKYKGENKGNIVKDFFSVFEQYGIRIQIAKIPQKYLRTYVKLKGSLKMKEFLEH